MTQTITSDARFEEIEKIEKRMKDIPNIQRILDIVSTNEDLNRIYGAYSSTSSVSQPLSNSQYSSVTRML